jgi:hypothetical protein
MWPWDHEYRSHRQTKADEDARKSKYLPFREHAPHHTRPRMKSPKWESNPFADDLHDRPPDHTVAARLPVRFWGNRPSIVSPRA